MSPRPKPGVLEIAPYVPGKAKAAGFASPIKLSANENALGSSPAARAAYGQAAGELNLYPDPRASALRDAIARKFDLEPSRIVFGTGSDELFAMAAQVYLQPGDNIVQPEFGFAAWAIAARAAGGLVRSAPERDLTVDVDALLGAIDDRTRIVFVANPANPTGTALPAREIERLHANLPERVLLLLDGAYSEFLGAEGGEVDLRLARKADNVLATRTFSKIHGLAALRIGWGYGAAAIIEALDRIRLPFNSARPAQAAAIAALDDDAFVARSIAHVIAGRGRLASALTQLGFAVTPSAANFVTMRCASAEQAAAIEQKLGERGVLVRGLRGYGLPDRLRITIGTDPELDAIIAALRDILAGEA